MITLTPLRTFDVQIQAASISPDTFKGLSVEEISKLPATEGNRQLSLCNLFKIEQDNASTPDITINGDVGKVKRIGQGMKSGEIVINGNCGMHTGEKIRRGCHSPDHR